MTHTASENHDCVHCGDVIQATGDAGVPYVHRTSGNGFCDVSDPTSAVELAAMNFTGMRTEAQPHGAKEDA